MIKPEKIHAAIEAVCPIDGVSIGSEDKATWSIAFKADATGEQRDAAINLMAAFDPDAPSVDDVRAEAQRRIIALVGASDITSCLIKQLNANMRANELNDYRHDRELTAEENAEAKMLRVLAEMIKAIRAASNAFAEPIPTDYRDDKFWPIGT